MKIVSAVGYTLCRVPVDSVVCKLMMFNNAIVDFTISRHSFVFSQSCLEVPASLSNVGGLAVRALDLVNRSLFVVRFVLALSLTLVSKCRSIVIALWATRMLQGLRIHAMVFGRALNIRYSHCRSCSHRS